MRAEGNGERHTRIKCLADLCEVNRAKAAQKEKSFVAALTAEENARILKRSLMPVGKSTLIFDDWSGGLNTDLPADKISRAMATVLENADVRNKALQGTPGAAAYLTGLPTGFVRISEGQFKLTKPSEEEITLVYGTLSGADKLYVRPYLNSSGTWVDSWQELTEKEGDNAADAGTNTTTVIDAALLSTTNDYYNGWILYNKTRNKSSIITDYDQASKTITLAWAITAQTNGDTYFICRNPIYDVSGNSYFAPDTECKFSQRENSIDIITGSDAEFKLAGKSDMVLTVINGYQAFDDTDLNFTGLYLSIKPPLVLQRPWTQLAGVATVTYYISEATERSRWLVIACAKYDGIQEGPRWKGDSGDYDGTTFVLQSASAPTATSPGNDIELEAADVTAEIIQISVSISYGRDSGHVPLLIPKSGKNADDNGVIAFDRRISSIVIYAAQADDFSATQVKPITEWRKVKELQVNDAAWSGAGPTYTQTIYISSLEWPANAGVDISEYQGHNATKVHANADYIATVKNQTFVASAYADERRKGFIWQTPFTQAGSNAACVIPHTDYLDLGSYGIGKIMGIVESAGYLVAFSEDRIARMGVADSIISAEQQYQFRGVSSKNGIFSINGLVYFTALEDIYYYNPAQNVVKSITESYIRDTWRAISTANKQSAAIGYDRRYEKLVIAAGSTIYVYNIPKPLADTLSTDTQAIGSWQKYNVSLTFNSFYTNIEGACIGIDSTGAGYELFSSSSTSNALIYESPVVQGAFSIEAVRLVYTDTATLKVMVYDLEKNASHPIHTYRFPPQSVLRQYDVYKGCYSNRLKVRIEGGLNTYISKLIINPDMKDEG